LNFINVFYNKYTSNIDFFGLEEGVFFVHLDASGAETAFATFRGIQVFDLLNEGISDFFYDQLSNAIAMVYLAHIFT